MMSDVAGDKPVAGSQMTPRRRRRLMVLLIEMARVLLKRLR